MNKFEHEIFRHFIFLCSPGSCTHDTTLTNSLTKPGTTHLNIAVQPLLAANISTSTLYCWATTEKVIEENAG